MKDREIAAVKKLLEKGRELHAQQFDILEEINHLVNGDGGIADKLKALERTFDGLWGARYASGETGKYFWRYAMDRPNMKRLLRFLEPAEIEHRMTVYFTNSDPFYTKARHSFGLFASSVNSHVDPGRDREFVSSAVGCKHKPACKTDQEHTKRREKDMTSMFT